MQDIVSDLLWNVPEVQEEIARFLVTVPEYRRAEQEFYAALEPLEPLLGRARYGVLMDRLCGYLRQVQCVHYGFGLGLRRELIRSLCL